MNPTDPFLPEHMRDAMKRWIEHGILPGSFLTAVLENNLTEAIARADDINLRHLTNIVSYCYNNIPTRCWGSLENVRAWAHEHAERIGQ